MQSKSSSLYIVFLFGQLITGCTNPSFSTDDKKSSEILVARSLFMGSWLGQVADGGTTCIKDLEFEQFPDYHRVTASADANRLVMTIENFSDENCTQKKLSLIRTSNYVLSDVPGYPLQKNLDIIAVQWQISLYGAEVAAANVNNLCNFSDWVESTPKIVTGQCSEIDLSSSPEYTRLFFSDNGNALYGAIGNGNSPETRTTNIDLSVVYMKQ